MTDHQIQGEARHMAITISQKGFTVGALVKGREENEVNLIDQLLLYYGIVKVPLGGKFFLFYNIKDKKKRKRFIEKGLQEMHKLQEKYNEDMQKGDWNIVYW